MTSPFVKKLVANDRRTRDAAVDSLRNFLSASRQFENIELLKLWKGLYYCFWHSDRTPVQQTLAKDLAELCLKVKENNFLPFLRAFWTTICREWKSIDVLRLDKFYTLLRRFVGAAFQRLHSTDWSEALTEAYIDLLEEIPLSATDQKILNGIRYHLADIYLEELVKVVPEEQREDVPMNVILRPFERLITTSPTKAVRIRVMTAVFDNEDMLKTFGYDVPDISQSDGIRSNYPKINNIGDAEHSSESETENSEDESAEEDVEFTGFD